jgi:uridine kinase
MEPSLPKNKNSIQFSTQSKKSKKAKMKEEIQELKRRKSSFKMELKNLRKQSSPIPEHLQLRSPFNMPGLSLDPKTEVVDSKSKQINRPVIIGITGGSGSGKSLIAKTIKSHIKEMGLKISRIKEKNFLKAINIEDDENRMKYLHNYDFDSTSAIDWDLFKKCVNFIEQGRPFNTPIYDIFTQKRILRTKKIKPADLIIIEGRLFFNDEELRTKCDVKIFMDTDSDIMLSRRVFHNILRKHNLKEIIYRYNKFVKPAYEKLIEPNKCHADLVIPNYGGTRFNMKEIDKNTQTIQILVDLLKFRLKDTNTQAKRMLENVKNLDNLEL